MASGSFDRAFVSSRSPAECWTVLTDVDQLASWVDIVRDVTVHAPLASYGATLEDRVGPFSLRADLDVSVTEAEEPRRVMFEASGQDRQVGSRLHIRAGMDLERSGDVGTRVRFSGTYAVEGRVATLGAPMIHRKAAAILEKFTARAEQELR
jgi:uncharacterized protein